MDFVFALLTLTVLSNLVLGILVLRGAERNYGISFGATLFAISVWAIGDLLLLFGRTETWIDIGSFLFYAGPVSIPVSILLFSLSFPHSSPRLSKAIMVGVAETVAWILGILWFPDFLLKNVVITHTLNHVTPNRMPFLLYTAHFSFFFIITYIVLLKRYRNLTGQPRQQVGYTFLGVVIASCLGMVTNLSLPLMGHGQFIWLGPILTLIFVFFVSAAIIRHSLFDIRVILARSLAYVISLVTLASIFGFTVFGSLLVISHQHFSIAFQMFLSGSTAVAALLFAQFKRFFDRLTNRIFYQDSYDAQVLLNELNRTYVATLNIDALLSQSAQIIADNLKADFCLLGVHLEEIGHHVAATQKIKINRATIEQLSRDINKLDQTVIAVDNLDSSQASLKRLFQKLDIAVFIRLTPNVKYDPVGLGYMVLGPKKSGSQYTMQDFRVLDTIGKSMIIAMQNAIQFEEIQTFNETLQQRINDATRKLSRTNTKLKDLDETKDDFISMASHQLRTPLTSVKGYLSMVLEGDAGSLTSMQRQMLTQAFGSSQRMVYLIADLLNVSRLKTGKFIIESTPVNLAKVVSEEIAQLVEEAKSRQLTLNYDPPKNFPELQLDVTKIRQVIMNFADNAIYYTPAGGTIDIKLIDNPSTIELQVVDNGMGVPRSEQGHLFTKFYRAGNARKARPDGTGLGLFMAKKVIAAQGGSIIFKSHEGKGSTFGFIFSKAKLAVPATPVAPPVKHLKPLT